MSFVPSSKPVNIDSLNNNLYFVDLATINGVISPSPGYDLVIKQTPGDIYTLEFYYSGVVAVPPQIDSTALAVGQKILIKDTTSSYGLPIGTPEQYIPFGGTPTIATRFPPNAPGLPNFPPRGVNDALQSPPALPNYSLSNLTGGVVPYNYYLGHPYRNPEVIDIKEQQFGIYEVTEITQITTVPAFAVVKMTRTESSINLLPGSQIFVQGGNVNNNRIFILESNDTNFALGYTGNNPGGVYDATTVLSNIQLVFGGFVNGSIGTPNTVTSVGSLFTKYLSVGMTIRINNFSNAFTITDVNSDIQLTVAPAFTSSFTNANLSYIPVDGIIREPLTTLNSFTVSVISGSTQVIGTGSTFLTQLKPGYVITIYKQASGIAESRIIASIQSNTVLTLTSAINIIPTGNNYSVVFSPNSTLIGTVDTINGNININATAGDLTLFQQQVRTGDKIRINGRTFTVDTVTTQTNLTVTVAPLFTGSGYPIYKLYPATQNVILPNNSQVVDGNLTDFTVKLRPGFTVTIGPQNIFLNPPFLVPDVIPAFTTTVSSIISNTQFNIADLYTGLSLVYAAMTIPGNNSIIFDQFTASTSDPLNINTLNANNVNTDNLNVDVSATFVPGSTVNFTGAIISGLSITLNNPSFIDHMVGRRVEAYQISNWFNTGFDSSGLPVPPFDGPDGNTNLNLQIYSQTGTVSFQGQSTTDAGGNPYDDLLVKNSLTDINNITADGVVSLGSLAKTGLGDISVADNFDMLNNNISNVGVLTVNQLAGIGAAVITVTSPMNLGANSLTTTGTVSANQLTVNTISSTGVITVNKQTTFSEAGTALIVNNNATVSGQLSVPIIVSPANMSILPGSSLFLTVTGANSISLGSVGAGTISIGTGGTSTISFNNKTLINIGSLTAVNATITGTLSIVGTFTVNNITSSGADLTLLSPAGFNINLSPAVNQSVLTTVSGAGNITSTSVNGNITASASGTGNIAFSTNSGTLNLTTTSGILSLTSGGQLVLSGTSINMNALTDFNGNSITDILTITGQTTNPLTLASANNRNIELSPNGSGTIMINAPQVTQETVVDAVVAVGAATMVASDVRAGIYTVNITTGPVVVTTPSATAIISAFAGIAVGDCVKCLIVSYNGLDADNITFLAGAGITLLANMRIPGNTSRLVTFRVTAIGADAIFVY